VVKQINSNRQKEFLVVGSYVFFILNIFGGFDQSGKVWNNVKK
jgi:hypothetical protein